MKSYSNLAHIPWALAILGVGIGLALLGVPVSFISATGGAAVCIAREVTYQWIEKHGGLRANMPDLEGFNVPAWNSHSKIETILAVVAAYLVATAVYLWFGL
jgi:uncharacterized membrane protein AbrB (regulator of aidB expression)